MINLILELIGFIIVIIGALIIIADVKNESLTCCTIPLGFFALAFYIAGNTNGKLVILFIIVFIALILSYREGDLDFILEKIDTDDYTNTEIYDNTKHQYPQFEYNEELFDINRVGFNLLITGGMIEDYQARALIKLRSYGIFITDFNDLRYLGFNENQIILISKEFCISDTYKNQQFNYDPTIINKVINYKNVENNENIIEIKDNNNKIQKDKLKSQPEHPKENNENNNNKIRENNIDEVKPTIEIPKEKIDINKATKEELTKLPGINIILANKIIQMRQSGNYITSSDDLKEKLNLKDYQVNQLMNYIIITKIQTNSNVNGRKIDL